MRRRSGPAGGDAGGGPAEDGGGGAVEPGTGGVVQQRTASGRRRPHLGEVVDPALEAFDPLEQGSRVVVGLRMGEPDDGDLERDPGVEGVSHRHHRRSQHLHRAHGPRRPEQENRPAVGTRRSGHRGAWRLAVARQTRCHGRQELAA